MHDYLSSGCVLINIIEDMFDIMYKYMKWNVVFFVCLLYCFCFQFYDAVTSCHSHVLFIIK